MYIRANEVKPSEYCSAYNGKQIFIKIVGDSQTFVCLSNMHNPAVLPVGKMCRLQHELVVLVDNPFQGVRHES